ncbi:MAG: S8 family serine peptidase [Clostridia bacterium]|nr:S8 family serine peptidase [Clostridia bacterium]
MKLKSKAKILTFIAVFAAMLILLLYPAEVTFAILPEGYVNNTSDSDFHWWTGEKGLDIATLKRTVDAWRANEAYDFDYLEQNPVVIAVIDTGINLNHIMFTGKYDENGKAVSGTAGANGVGEYDVLLRDGSGNPIVKNTYFNNTNVTDDASDKHGTHVAGIIATLIHWLDLEKYIKILPIKASHKSAGKSGFYGEDVSEGVAFAIANGAAVINMSLAYSNASDAESFAGLNTSNAYEKAVLVAAAGNEGKVSGKHMNIFGKVEDYTAYPAGNSNVIGVMNYAKDGYLLESSNYGDEYDLCAPGSKIFSVNGATVDDYKALSGTSMASPVVAFGAGLITLKYRATREYFEEEMTAVDIAEKVRGAYTKKTRRSADDTISGEYPVFDINELVGISWRDAEISIKNPALVSQQLGNIKPVKLSLDVYPASEVGNGSVEWFTITDDGEKKIEKASGFELIYTPSAKIGTTIIKAVWTPELDSEDIGIVPVIRTFELKVDYMQINGQTIKQIDVVISHDGEIIDGLSECEIGVTYKFSLSNTDNFAPIDGGNIMWYVNGEYKRSGKTYLFTPQSDGEYSVRAKIKGVYTSEAVMTVGSADDIGDSENIILYLIPVIVAVSVIVAVVIGIVAYKKSKEGKRN